MIHAAALVKEYRMGDTVVRALDGVSLRIAAGEFVSVVGASGSGKSTLMHILGCLDRPTSGRLEFQGSTISDMSEKQLAAVRNRHIGFVFQTFNLINRTSAFDNVMLPLVYTRQSFARAAAREALQRVGLEARARHRPSEMSGGECQRVAIARAIVNRPDLLLADEPTGNLDSRTGEQIMEIFHGLHASGITVVLVTHEMDIAAQADRMIRMRDGKVIEDIVVDAAQREQMFETAQDAHRKALRRKSAGGEERSPTLLPGRPRLAPERG